MSQTTTPPAATRRRTSLSSLFLNQVSAAERAHLAGLQALSEQHQGRAFYIDDDDLRIMYLNQHCLQSAMRISDPVQLVCAYSKVMLSALLLTPAPQSITIVGLGGGSLAKYLHRHLPDCRISAIEIRPDVIALRDAFALPDDARLNIIEADAASYLPEFGQPCDLLILDAYDKDGLVAALNTAEFYACCHRLLKPGGTLVANVWGKPSVLAPMLHTLQQQFDGRVGYCRSPDSYNLLVFASRDLQSAEALTDRLSTLQQTHPDIDFDFCLRAMDASRPAAPQDNARILQQLRQLLTSDPAVPRDYAEWKRHILSD